MHGCCAVTVNGLMTLSKMPASKLGIRGADLIQIRALSKLGCLPSRATSSCKPCVNRPARTHARDQGDQSVFAAGLSEDCQMLNRAACSEAIQHLFTLKPEQKDVFILVVVAGYSYEEAAKICKCSIGTIKSRINRARAQLETLYDDASEASARGARPRSFHAVADLLLYADRLVQRAA